MNSYVGNTPTTGHFPTDTFTSSGGSTYTLSKAPATLGAIEVSVQGVLQAVSAYSLSGATLTLAGVTSGDVVFVRHLGETLQVPVPVDDSVTTAKILDANVTTAKIADGAITAAKIADGTIVATEIASNAVTTAKILDANVTTAKINADAVDGTKIADNTLDSEHYVAGSVDLEHMSSQSVDEDNLYISNAGTNGQVLSKQSGNSGGLTWTDAPGGGFKFLAHTRVLYTSGGSAVSAIEFDASDGIDNSTYSGYFFHITRMFGGNNGRYFLRYSDDDGSTWKTSSYQSAMRSLDMNGTEEQQTFTSTNAIRLCNLSSGNSAGFFSNIQVYVPSETLSYEFGWANIQGASREDSSSYHPYAYWGSGCYGGGSAAGGWDAFQFLAESGNIAACISMYGLVKA
jgi:hypothetical protein